MPWRLAVATSEAGDQRMSCVFAELTATDRGGGHQPWCADFPRSALRDACQRGFESWPAGGSDYRAPGQRVEDFLAGRPSDHFGVVTPSYKPGVKPTDLAGCLPGFVIVEAIREALPVFGRQDPPDTLVPMQRMTGWKPANSVAIIRRRPTSGRSTTLHQAVSGGRKVQGYAGASFPRRSRDRRG
ncbi:MAG: hypothetical protein R3E03_02600 [Novosphingobium sp.]